MQYNNAFGGGGGGGAQVKLEDSNSNRHLLTNGSICTSTIAGSTNTTTIGATTTPTDHLNNSAITNTTTRTDLATNSVHDDQTATSMLDATQHANDIANPEPGLDPDQEQEQEPEIDIVINNVVCSFSVRCHLNLRGIALSGRNVEYRRENGMVTMKLRRPYTTASIWSSGRITCTGSTSEVMVSNRQSQAKSNKRMAHTVPLRSTRRSKTSLHFSPFLSFQRN